MGVAAVGGDEVIARAKGACEEAAAQGLMAGSERRGTRPEQMVAYVCQEPAPGESGRDVMHRLAPLAQLLRLPAAPIFGPMLLSGAAHVAEWVALPPP